MSPSKLLKQKTCMEKFKIGDKVITSVPEHKGVVFEIYDVVEDKGKNNWFAKGDNGFYEIFTNKEITKI